MDILELFKIPKNAQADNRVYNKDIVAALGLTGKDKAALEKSISTTTLKGVINEKTSGIWSYESESYFYKAVFIFFVVLKDDSKLRTINEFVQKAFPNPTVVIYKYGEKYAISTALKRINKLERDKAVIDDIQITDLFALDEKMIQLLGNIKYEVKDLKEYYENIDYIISAYYILKLTGKIPTSIDFTIKTKSMMVQQLLAEKRRCEADLKIATSVREKMELNSKIKEIDKKMEAIF